jgi:hypothetical protein
MNAPPASGATANRRSSVSVHIPITERPPCYISSYAMVAVATMPRSCLERDGKVPGRGEGIRIVIAFPAPFGPRKPNTVASSAPDVDTVDN